MKDLFKYFQENWDRKPFPVIDHALRIDRLEDGSFHFYIHPSNTDGITTDFVVSEDERKERLKMVPSDYEFIQQQLKYKIMRRMNSSKKTESIVGKKFGLLLIIGRVPTPEGKRKGPAYILANCDCGKETIIEARRARDGHTTSCGCKRRDKEEALFQRVWNNYRTSARKRGYELTLTRDDVRKITALPCYYCHRENSYGLKTSRGLYQHKHNGIDRRDNTKGYTLANSCPCCFRCNQAKSSMTETEFFDWIKSVYEVHHGSE